MTTATMKTGAATTADTRSRFYDAARSFWKVMSYRNHQRRSIRHLGSLSDQTLKDIGVHRSEITRVVYGRDAERVRYHEV